MSGDAVLRAEAEIRNSDGLHLRAADSFVRQASLFRGASVFVSNGVERVNGKSIIGVLTLGLTRGDKLVIEVSGDGAEEALRSLVDLVENNFNL